MAWFRLAEKLGCTVEELKQRITSKEYTEWRVYFKVKEEETPSVNSWLMTMMAQLCYVVAKSNGAKNVSIDDFMLKKKQKDTNAEIINKLQHWRMCYER